MNAKLGLLTIALDHLTVGRAALYEAILGQSQISNSESEIEKAVSGLRQAGQQQYLLFSPLTRARQRFLTGAITRPESAQSDLDEAWESPSSPMPNSPSSARRSNLCVSRDCRPDRANGLAAGTSATFRWSSRVSA